MSEKNIKYSSNLGQSEISDIEASGEGKKIKRIAVLTSGGDAPGMNAAIRAVVRTAINNGIEVMGVKRGYHGLWRGDFIKLGSRDVSEYLQRGGTFLMTARSVTFNTPEGLQKAKQMLSIFNCDALVVIGGDGSYKGASDLSKIGVKVICIPGTIDNDISSTEYTIGYDTAMNTAMQAIDKIKDTGQAHERCSVIEVMGRSAGYIAQNVGMATGAEVILLPEIPFDFNKDVIKRILECRNSGKRHYVVVVAEGAGDATDIAKRIEDSTGIETRPTILGYVQRGGSPSLRDRIMASRMGYSAVACLLKGKINRAICVKDSRICDVDLEEALKMEKKISLEEYENAKIVAL